MKNRLIKRSQLYDKKSQVVQPLVLFKVVIVFLISNLNHSKPNAPVKSVIVRSRTSNNLEKGLGAGLAVQRGVNELVGFFISFPVN